MSASIDIPDHLVTDRAVRRLVTAWRNHHASVRQCIKRENYYKRNASTIEKLRRKRKWTHIAKILEIEATLLRWCAQATHHPDIWMSAKPERPESALRVLHRQYVLNRKNARLLSGTKRRLNLEHRKAIVARIRTIERNWMVALFEAVYPDTTPPAPVPYHPTELRPRKVRKAMRELQLELI